MAVWLICLSGATPQPACASGGASEWRTQKSGTTAWLIAVSFANTNTGWATGGSGGTIRKTTDGGRTWVPQDFDTESNLWAVYALDSSTCVAAGGNGTMLRTVDGGRTWKPVSTGTTNWIKGLKFVSGAPGSGLDPGWAVTTGGEILRTTDGGRTWAHQASGTTAPLNGVDFISASTGWVVGSGGTILKTSNGGMTWVEQNSGISGQVSLMSVDFVSSSTGWVAANDGSILKTTNGGNTWFRQKSQTTELLRSVRFADASNGWAVGGKAIRKTSNGGQTWTAQTTPLGTDVDLRALDVVDAEHAWVTGGNGAIIKFSKAATPTKRAIYYIPGFLSSELFDKNGDKVWIDSVRLEAESAKNSDILALDSTGTRPLDPANWSRVSWTKDDYGTRNCSEDVLRLLKSEFPGVPVKNFIWDWRKDIDEAATWLANDVEANGYTDVDIVTHSTGGLVAAAYLAQSPANVAKTKHLVTIASPSLGTFPSMYAIETGTMYNDFWNNKLLLNAWVRKSMKNSPAAYQLFPSTEYLKKTPMHLQDYGFKTTISSAQTFYRLVGIYGTVNLNQSLLHKGPLSHEVFRASTLNAPIADIFESVDSLHIASTGVNTIVSAEYTYHPNSASKRIFLGNPVPSKAGDGTVPLYSALTGRSTPGRRPRSVFLRYLGVKHSDLVERADKDGSKGEQALQAMVGFLRDEITVSGADVASSQRETIRVSSLAEDPTMSDTLKYEFTDAQGAEPCTKTIDVVRVADGQVVASASGEHAYGWDDLEFSYYSLDSEGSGFMVCSPKTGYRVVVRVGSHVTEPWIRGEVSALDDEGAVLASGSFEASGGLQAVVCEAGGFAADAPQNLRVSVVDRDGVASPLAQVAHRDDYVTQLEIETTNTVVPLGDTQQMRVFIVPFGADATWSAVETDVVQVDDCGLVTAVGYGRGNIVASSADGNKSDTIEITVPYDAESIALDCANPYLVVGERASVVASFTPSFATNRDLMFSSDATDVASVDGDGVVTAMSAGSATITARSSNDLTETIGVCVSEPPVRVTGLTMDDPVVSVRPSHTAAATARVLPDDSTWPELRWVSSDNGVFSIEATSAGHATVFGSAPGIATLTATSVDGGFVSSCQVVVDGNAPSVSCAATSQYVDSAVVAMAASDDSDGSGVASLSYRLDGEATVTVSGTSALITTYVSGPHILTVWATDRAGNESPPVVRLFSVSARTSLSMGASTSSPTYGRPVTLSAKLDQPAEGKALAGRSVVFERWTGSVWASVGSATTASNGVATKSTTPYRNSKTIYRARFAGATPYLSSTSISRVIRPLSFVRIPIAPKTMRRTKYYTVYGYLKPRHTAGTYPVRIYKWKKTSTGKWKSYGYVKAKASNYSSYSKYSRKIRLSSKGKWRLRAYAPADSGHAATWSSGYDYVTVR